MLTYSFPSILRDRARQISGRAPLLRGLGAGVRAGVETAEGESGKGLALGVDVRGLQIAN